MYSPARLRYTGTMLEDIWDRIWRDEDGHVVIFQWPNAWLIGWVVLTMGSLLTSSHVSDVFAWGGDISLVVWSGLEIFRGANYFRKALGVLVLVFCVLTIIRSF